jgi:hypothetical protein
MGEGEKSIRQAWEEEGFNAPTSVGLAWEWFEEHLNAGLRPFQISVSV